MPAKEDIKATDSRAKAIRRDGSKRIATDFYLHVIASNAATNDADHPIKTGRSGRDHFQVCRLLCPPDYDGRQGWIADGKFNDSRMIARPPACHLYRRHLRPCRDNVTDCPARERKTHGKPRRWYKGHHCMSNTFPSNWFQHNRSSNEYATTNEDHLMTIR